MMVPLPTPEGPQMTSEAAVSLLRNCGSVLIQVLIPTKCKNNSFLHIDGVVLQKNDVALLRVPHEMEIIVDLDQQEATEEEAVQSLVVQSTAIMD
jgi:hypothetical protein